MKAAAKVYFSRLTAHAKTEVKAEVKARTKTAMKAGDRCEGHQGATVRKVRRWISMLN